MRTLCRLLKASKSGYYQFSTTTPTRRECDNAELVSQIKAIHKESYSSYGYRRMHVKLKHGGLQCGKNRVQHLMKTYQLSAKRKKRFINTTLSQHDRTISPNLLKRQFNASLPNTHWVSDLTYIRTKTGWAYLAVIIDLYSRAVVGWSIDKQMPTFLVLDALNTAIGTRKPRSGLLFHSDRGVQYASDQFQRTLNSHGIKGSMSRKGDCWDNAVAESFFKTIKTELKLEKNNLSFEETKANVSKYIDEFYNHSRLHSYIGYKPPLQFEKVA